MRRLPTALTQDQFNALKGNINHLEAACIAQCVQRTFDVVNVVSWLFHDDTISAMKNAFGRTYHAVNQGIYTDLVMKNFDVDSVAPRVSISIDFEPMKMLAPADHLLQEAGEDAMPLIYCFKHMYEIHREWQQVRDVAKWLDINATAGAMRSIWPCVLALVPDKLPGSLHQCQGQRYREVPGIGEWVERLRSTTYTIASALLLPQLDAAAKIDSSIKVWFNYSRERVITETWDRERVITEMWDLV